MTSKERIAKIFKHQMPDRIGIFDFFDKLTLLNWERQLFLKDQDPADYFDFDLEFRLKKPKKDKFIFFSFNGPFQQFATDKKLQPALIDFIREPNHTKEFFKNRLADIFSEYSKLEKEGAGINGAFLYEDIAYDNGLYFSIDKYKEMLFDFHKEINGYFRDKGLFVVFHCDGCIEGLMPCLIKANFSGVHPLQELANPNLLRLKKDLKGAITFIGGVGLSRLKIMGSDTDAAVSDPIYDRVHELKEGGNYIFCFDGPVPQDTDFNVYKDIITHIKSTGTYNQ